MRLSQKVNAGVKAIDSRVNALCEKMAELFPKEKTRVAVHSTFVFAYLQRIGVDELLRLHPGRPTMALIVWAKKERWL